MNKLLHPIDRISAIGKTAGKNVFKEGVAILNINNNDKIITYKV